MTRPETIALVGPTASGKSDAAHAAALEHGSTEIVAVDAMTAYRGMDVGTAKPTAAQRDEVRYHLIDIADPCEELSVRRFAAACAEALDGIAARGSTALLVGGSGLYYRAVVDQIQIPPRDAQERDRLEAMARRPGGLAALFCELEALDPLAASRIDPRNERRVVRALEVVRSTGRAFSSFGDGLSSYPESRARAVGIAFDAARTDAAIEARFARWLDEGLLDEVRALAASPGGISRTARQAAGYRQLLAHVEDGVALPDAVAAALAATRRLARRQWRWFRRDPRIAWADDALGARRALRELLEAPRRDGTGRLAGHA